MNILCDISTLQNALNNFNALKKSVAEILRSIEPL